MFLKALATLVGISIPVSSAVISHYAYKGHKPDLNSDVPSLLANNSKLQYPKSDPLSSNLTSKLDAYKKDYVPTVVFSDVLKFIDTPEFQEDANFASLISFSEFWSRWSYPSNEQDLKTLEPNPIDLSKPEFRNLKKSKVRSIFIDLLDNFKSNAVGALFNGVILEFPSKPEDSKLFNLSSNFYLDKDLIPTFIDSQIYVQPFSNFSNDSNNLQKYKDEFMNHKDQVTSVSELPKDNSVSYISYSSLKQKAQDWFKFWGDSTKQKEGDFYLSENFSSISIGNKKFPTYDIFKIHNGKQYKLSLIFKATSNLSEYSVLRFRTIGKYRNPSDVSMRPYSRIDHFIYTFFVLSKLVNFPEGTDNKNLSSSNLGEISANSRKIYWHERFSNCQYRVKNYKYYLNQIYTKK